MQGVLQRLRYSLRTLSKSTGPNLTILLTLMLGIGANTAIFTMDYATLLAPLPYPYPDQLVNVWSKFQGRRNTVSPGDFADWKRQSAAFQDLNAWGADNFHIAAHAQDRPEFIDGLEATTGYCAMLGQPLSLGRCFLPEEGKSGREHVVILSHRLWQRLGANRQIVGQTIRINAEPYIVVGVMAPGSADRRDEELIVPLVFKPKQQVSRDARYWGVTGRLKPGVTIQQAQARMDWLTAREAQDYPASNRGWSALVEPLKNDFLPQGRQLMLWLLLVGVGLLLLMACLNVANLLLAQGITRQRAVAIRAALGASPSSIFGEVLTESVVLAVMGGIMGIAAGYAVLKGLVAMAPPDTLPAEADLRLNLPVLLVMFATTALAGTLCGYAPAWYASRLNPADVLGSGGRLGIHTSRQRLRRLLLIGEFALALPMLAGAGLTIRSLWNLTHVDLGARTDHILGFYVDSPSIQENRGRINSYYRSMLASIAAVPGVTNVSALEYLPLDRFHEPIRFSIAGKAEYADPLSRPSADIQMATPDYFQTFRIQVLRGRTFTDSDTETSPRIAMVNEAFATRFLKDLNPLDQRLVMDQWIPGEPSPRPAVEWQVVGVFGTVKSRGAREDYPQIAVPFWQMGPPVAGIGVRTGPVPEAMVDSISAAIGAVDSQAALALTRTMEQVHGEALANDRFMVVLFLSFAMAALLLAVGGVHGVTAFSAAQRTKEIALRMALGATPSRVVALVLTEGLTLASIGSVTGVLGAWFAGRAMQGILFGVPGTDLLTLIAMGLGLLLPALGACYYPAHRASAVEIMQLLKAE